METDNPLRAARLARGLTLEEIAERTALGVTRVADLDAARFDRLPGGLYARAYVRAFASAVGLEPARAVEELADRLPGAPDPLPVLREVVRERGPESVGEFIELFVTERLAGFAPPMPRYAAAAVDGALLLVINGAVALLTAAMCGVRLGALLDIAAPALLAIGLLTTALYFLLLAGVAGLTPGARLCGLPPPARQSPLNLPAIHRRASRAVLHEGSILVDLAIECAVSHHRKAAPESAESLG